VLRLARVLFYFVRRVCAVANNGQQSLEKEVKLHHEGRDSLEYKHHTILIHPLILQIDQNEYPQAQ